jgi:hypothetical protein
MLRGRHRYPSAHPAWLIHRFVSVLKKVHSRTNKMQLGIDDDKKRASIADESGALHRLALLSLKFGSPGVS